eukprot:XP_016663341.1 PREDICTED: uncharacterized protein LOC107884866 [Acyrthosiphon pisum]
MTNPFQENVNEQFMIQIPQTKNIMLNIRKNYNVTHDHNYHLKNKQKCQQHNGKKYLNHSEILINDYDGYGTIPNWCVDDISGDEENYTEDMSLSEILKIELEKDLLHKYKNKNCKDYLLQLDKDQIHKQLLWLEHNFKVCPQLKLIHLIYLTIKNSATENVTCYDIQRKIRSIINDTKWIRCTLLRKNLVKILSKTHF